MYVLLFSIHVKLKLLPNRFQRSTIFLKQNKTGFQQNSFEIYDFVWPMQTSLAAFKRNRTNMLSKKSFKIVCPVCSAKNKFKKRRECARQVGQRGWDGNNPRQLCRPIWPRKFVVFSIFKIILSIFWWAFLFITKCARLYFNLLNLLFDKDKNIHKGWIVIDRTEREDMSSQWMNLVTKKE